MSALVPCPGCARHVRVGESRCPFCDAFVGDSVAPTVRRIPGASLTRALIFSGAAAIALAACGPDEPVAQPYGAPPDDNGGEQTPPDQTPPEQTPPQQQDPDAGTQATPDDPGQPMLMYGGPPGG